MYWGLGYCENTDTPTCISPNLICGISSSLPMDVGQKLNHINPWCSLVLCVFIYFMILGLLCSYCLFLGDLSIVIIFSQSIIRWDCY